MANCNGYIEVDFSSLIVVNSTMKVIPYTQSQLMNIPVHISINASNLYSYVKEENYCPVGGVTVPNPCDPVTPLTVPCVTLNEVKVSGPINFVIGAEVIDTTGRAPVATPVAIPGVSVNIQGLKGSTATTNDSIYINDEILLYLDALNTPAPNLKLSLTKLYVQDHKETSDGDNYYEILGTFKIEKDI